MTKSQNFFLFLLRISLGWLFFYSGITKIFDPNWSAEGYLKGAKNFVWFYQWFSSPDVIPFVNFLNEWGQLFLGISLILGIAVRLSSKLGILMMLLYYFVILDFPYPNAHSFLVDEHIIYSLVLLFFAKFKVGRVWGLADWCSNLPICSKFPKLRKWIG